MDNPSDSENHSGMISGFSNGGNPIIKPDGWNKRVVVVTNDGSDNDKGDRLRFSIKKEHQDHYQAKLATKPNYSSPPNISIHHDGKHGESVGDTRSKKEAFESPEDRKFDPTIQGAPRLSDEKPDRSHLREE